MQVSICTKSPYCFLYEKKKWMRLNKDYKYTSFNWIILLLVLLLKSKHSIVSRSLAGCRLFGIPRRRHLRRKWGKPVLVCGSLVMFMLFDNTSFVPELLLLIQVMSAMWIYN